MEMFNKSINSYMTSQTEKIVVTLLDVFHDDDRLEYTLISKKTEREWGDQYSPERRCGSSLPSPPQLALQPQHTIGGCGTFRFAEPGAEF